MYIERQIDKELMIWKNSPSRKPLLIRGARQVGKSTAIRHFGEQFEYFIEINFDENPQFVNLFTENATVDEIIEQLAIISNTKIKEGKTLIFLDEIQTCIPAISSLRYFYERRPDLHIIAAGSLLEFALAELPSFGVGRVRSMFMYPFSFSEFLNALNENSLLNVLMHAKISKPLHSIIHDKLKKNLKKFLIIGGMPEAVQAYVTKGDLLEVQRVLDDLIISLQADFTKYKKRIPAERVKSVFDSIINQVGKKFIYSDQHTSLTNVQIKQVVDLLEMAGLVYTVTHSSCNGIPLGAEANFKKRKLLIFDTGIFQRMLGLDIASLLLKDEFDVINKGNIAELFVGLELLKKGSCYEKNSLYYWHREVSGSEAEVDYVIQHQDKIIPIEVKAGTKGSMKSMFIFLQEKKSEYGIRLCMENFSAYENVKVIPLYATGVAMENML